MLDPRHPRLAQVLVDYSLAIRPGDKPVIYSTPQGLPLIREVYRHALRAGAYPTARLTHDDLLEIKLREGSDVQVSYLSDLDRQEIEHFDARLHIIAEENTKALSGVAPEKMALYEQGQAPRMERMMERFGRGELRWCVTLFPTPAHAQDAGMSLPEYEEFVYGACLLDQDDPAEGWRSLAMEQQRIAAFLSRHDAIRIEAPETDITFRTAGRIWVSSDGHEDFPDGEVFTAPIEESVKGTISFSYPVVYGGRELKGVRLTFREGRAETVTASEGQDLLEKVVDQDTGARFVGEVAFGLNYGIRQFTRSMLFDEKIGGTVHLALGMAYPDSGGRNQSALHLDMLLGMGDGPVYADGELCYEAGRFIL